MRYEKSYWYVWGTEYLNIELDTIAVLYVRIYGTYVSGTNYRTEYAQTRVVCFVQ